MIQGTFHHIGLACRNLDREARSQALLGYHPEQPDFEDPLQGIRGRFLVGPGPRLELVTPTRPEGVLDPWLQRGAKMYHLAFTVPDLAAELERLEAQGARLVTGPVPAVAFAGRAIAFLMLPSLMLIELIQEAP